MMHHSNSALIRPNCRRLWRRGISVEFLTRRPLRLRLIERLAAPSCQP